MLAIARAAAPRRSSAIFSSFFFHNTQWLDRKLLNDPNVSLPPDAYKKVEALTPKRLPKVYLELSKSRLTVLNVLTAMSGVALSPLQTTVPILLSTAVGTALCSASANALNQLQEVPFDAQMARTRNRPLCRRAISPSHATGFAIITGIAGPALLWTVVNPATAVLGAANVALYAGAYTWMKRRSIWNTWLGAVVGAVPPLMGWTACGGKLWPSVDYPVQPFLPDFMSSGLPALDLSLIDNPLAPLALFMLLFSWQFPHFNSLSYVVRGSYAQAGYRMLSVLDPAKNALVSLRHAALLIPICSVLTPLSGLTTWAFALTSLPPNLICLRAAWKWWKYGGEKRARKVFQHSLWYLPVVMALMMFHKQGMDWSKWLGLSSEEEEKREAKPVEA
ncbi:Protoheme IX farnesyltransferase, mitochondrial [Leucoagaricus sp. SymC.cos]|nr:Protoheme IX farnesyltransferase, mitochondrial [Leucoagaricus sp. SymC.cos]